MMSDEGQDGLVPRPQASTKPVWSLDILTTFRPRWCRWILLRKLIRATFETTTRTTTSRSD